MPGTRIALGHASARQVNRGRFAPGILACRKSDGLNGIEAPLVEDSDLYSPARAHQTRPVKSIHNLLLTAALTFGAAAASYANPDDLPDIGSPAQAMLTIEEEYQIGRMIVRGLRDQDQLLEDPEVSEYIRTLGLRLSSQAHDGSQRFNFFMTKENTINAFALPGGFIGVNTGSVPRDQE